MPLRAILAILVLLSGLGKPAMSSADEAESSWNSGKFQWTAGPPLISPAERRSDPCHAIKDPTVVFHGGKWHVFATIRSQKRTHQIEYLNFTDWASADKAERHVLKISDSYFCAPQVFYFTPHKKWYLLFQTSDKTRKPERRLYVLRDE